MVKIKHYLLNFYLIIKASTVEIKTIHVDFCTKYHIKAFRIHPDTFVQMSIQLAYYQLHKRFTK